LNKKFSVVIIGVLVISMLAGCISDDEGETDDLSGTLALAGSTTVQPIASSAATAFMELHPDVIVTVQGGGSGTGVTQVGQGTVDIGNASREIKDSEYTEYPDLVPTAVAADGVVVVVHPSNPISDLTKDQIAQVFTGEIDNWSELGGPDQDIVVIIREDGSGTRATFEELVHKDVDPTDDALQKPSNGSAKTTVSETPYAIGYIGLGYVDDSVKMLKVGGVTASESTILDGTYPISRNLYMITNGEPEGLAKAFLDYVLSAEGQDIVAEEGFIKVSGASSTEELSGTIAIAGSTTVQPIASAAADAFMAANPNVTVTVQGGGSGTGVTQVGQGVVDIGNASREIKGSEYTEYPNLVPTAVAADGVTVVVNPSNAVSALSSDQIAQIFTGQITNWSEVGGADEEIVVVIREDGSGTRATFEELVHKGVDPTDDALQKPSNGAAKTTVAETPNAIGYIGLGYVDSSVKMLKVDGVRASETTITNGQYPISRNLYMITNGEPSGLAEAFIDYVLSDEGQEIVAEEGFIPLTEQQLSGTIAIAGSTTVQPIASAAADAFMAANTFVTVTVQGGGSGTGVTQVGQGVVDIGNASREIKGSEYTEYPNLVPTAVAADGVAVVTHPGNTVSNLTKDQIAQIFTGAITNWNEVGGPDEEIVVIIREDGSGTRATFEEIVHKGVDPSDEALQKPSNGAAKTTVSQTPYSIGYIGLGYVDGSVKVISVDGVAPSETTISNGTYSISRFLFMITNGEPDGLAKAFIEFILSTEGQDIVEQEGFIKL